MSISAPELAGLRKVLTNCAGGTGPAIARLLAARGTHILRSGSCVDCVNRRRR
ncbi:hypothetical protein [Streptomyces cavernae]|uniref:hypothetical protein n=1 Tax=Streptomyces cavernae TaxID=2259034 RepID=UPI0012D9ADFD|nr:hypothetical protein [Streptomyces cavernae]